MAETCILDKETVMGRIGNDEELWEELLEIFLDDTPQQIETLTQALAEQNIERLTRHAHSVKGAAANIGANRFRQLAYDLELAAGNSDWPRCQTQLEQINQAWQELQPLLQAQC